MDEKSQIDKHLKTEEECFEDFDPFENGIPITELYKMLTNNKRVEYLADHAKKKRTRKKT